MSGAVAPGAPGGQRRWLRVAAVASAALMLLLLAALGAIGWYYSGQILTPGGGAVTAELAEVLAVTEDQVTLEATARTIRPGFYGLTWDDGYAQVGPVVGEDGATVTRVLQDVPTGVLEVGQQVAVDGGYFPDDPEVADIDLVEVAVEGDLGTFPAYRSEGTHRTWVLVVHGRGGTRAEGFRLAGVLDGFDVPTMLLTYRNDEGAPDSPDGMYGMGSTEWRDVEAAIDWAVEHGAEDVILAGLSTGGTISAMVLHRSDRADRVAGLLLDAPVLDWGPTLRLGAQERGLPAFLTSVAMLVAEVRAGIPWAELDQVRRADDFDVPILLFHGDADRTVPIETSEAFAEARPDLVTYERVAGAGHVQAWNVDPEAYRTSVGAFLLRVGLPEVALTAP